MVPLDVLAAFALASFVLILVPGPTVLFVVGRSLSVGRRDGMLSVLGNELGALVLAAGVALGVGSVIAASVALFTTVKLAGAAYLVFLGVQAIRHRHADDLAAVDRGAVVATSAWRALRQGFTVGVTNPKTIVFFVAVLPQFVSREAGAVPLQMLVLSAVFVAIAFASDGAWVLLASAARARIASSPRGLAPVRATGGVMMIGLGALLTTSEAPRATA